MSHSAIPTKIAMDKATIDAHIHRLAEKIVARNPIAADLVLLGILRRGRPLAERIAAHIGTLTGVTPPVGSLATTLYRDDFHTVADAAKVRGDTHFDFTLDDRVVLLVDDVLAAGRTIRAAIDETMDYGRPRQIQLACLIDRGGRELPIQPDYLGDTLSVPTNQWVACRFEESDGEDVVYLEERAHTL